MAWRAIPYARHGDSAKAPADQAWNGGDETKAASPAQLAKMCALEQTDDLSRKSSFKLPHHTAAGNKVVLKGVYAAVGALAGARTAIKGADDSALKGAYSHLAQHYKQFGKTPPGYKEAFEPEVKEGERWLMAEDSNAVISRKDMAGLSEDMISSPRNAEGQEEYVVRIIKENETKGNRGIYATLAYTKWRTWRGKMADKVLANGEVVSNLSFFDTEGKMAASLDGLEDPGWVEGYGAAFNNVDAQREVIVPGAFAKTIQEGVPQGKVKLLGRHICKGATITDIIGSVTEGKEDGYGLWYHAELNETENAQTHRKAINRGDVGFNSIDYQPVKWSFGRRMVDGKNVVVRLLREVKWVGQTVTPWPANEAAVMTASKSMVNQAEDLTQAVLSHESDDLRREAAQIRSERFSKLIEGLTQAKAKLDQLLHEPNPSFVDLVHSCSNEVNRRYLQLLALKEEIK